MEQMTIFDVINNDIITEIKSKLLNFNIDNIYIKNFKGKECLIREISECLESQENYNEYINNLYNELTKYLPVLNENEETLIRKTGIYWLNNSIRVSQKGKEYSIWCLEMLDKNIFDEVQV